VSADRGEAQRAVGELVAHYQAKARAVGRLGVAIGATSGAAVGSVPLSPLRAAWPIPSSFGFATILGGLIVGVMIGYVIGDGRAQLYHRMAEQARLQLQLEERVSENDARLGQLLTALTARAAAAAQAQAAPPPQPQVVQPQPQPITATAYPQLRTVAATGTPSAPPLSPPPVSGRPA
jgi:Zn-dependent protease with chaperone function